jgi:fatty-acyl-CoA synthase
MYSSIPALLDVRAAETPERPAVGFPGDGRTYGEIAAASVLSARRLRAAGVEPGDRVGLLMREACVEYVTLALGVMRLGATCVPINARNKTHELAYVMDHAGLRAILADDEFTSLVYEAGPPEGCRHVVIRGDADFDAGAERVTTDDEVAGLQAGVGPGDPALLLYTSGTTASPKGCVISHGAMLAAGRNGVERLGLSAADRFWTPLAMFHVGGWQVLLSCFASGACASHVGFFDAATALAQLAGERVTVAFPAFELMWLAVLDQPGFADADLSALRLVMAVGVPERLTAMQARLPGAAQVSCFGMTESCGSICIGEAGDSLESRTTTSGRPMTGMELRVVDSDTRQAQPTGVAGELLLRGPATFSGYYRDPETTAKTIDADGWIATGDVARLNEDGSVTYMSRMKDMLKVGGENVSAAEVEGYLLTHPAVAIAAVVGAPDARYGEVGTAFVQLAPGAELSEEELIGYCVGSIATYKVPRYVRFVDEYPVTPMQKIQKVVLRERIEAELRERGVTEAPKLVTR